jgi:uroporphyrinogen-III decarboxylase
MSDTMTPQERVLAAISLKPTDRVPCALSLNYFVARHMGVTMAEFLLDLDLQMKLQHKVFEEIGGIDYVIPFPAKMIDPIPSFVFMPIKTKVPGKDLPADFVPQYEETEVMTIDGYDAVIKKGWVRYAKEDLIPKVFGEYKEMDLRYDEKADRKFYDDKKVYFPAQPAAWVPFEIFSLGRSLGKFTADMYRHPDKVISAMEAIMPELINAATSKTRTPGEPILIPISRSSNGFISPRQFEKFVFPYLKRIVEAIINRGHSVFFHLDQDWTKFLPYFQQFPEGKYLLHFDGVTDIIKAKELLGNRMCIMGDVPATLFSLGTPETVAAYCQKLIDTVGASGGFILGPGCTVPENAKFENVLAMVNTARTYRPKK